MAGGRLWRFALPALLAACVPLPGCTLLSGVGSSPVDLFESEAQQDLIRAVMRQDAGRMDRALAQGADINKFGYRGNTPLLVAIRRERLRIPIPQFRGQQLRGQYTK